MGEASTEPGRWLREAARKARTGRLRQCIIILRVGCAILRRPADKVRSRRARDWLMRSATTSGSISLNSCRALLAAILAQQGKKGGKLRLRNTQSGKHPAATRRRQSRDRRKAAKAAEVHDSEEKRAESPVEKKAIQKKRAPENVPGAPGQNGTPPDMSLKNGRHCGCEKKQTQSQNGTLPDMKLKTGDRLG